MKKLFLLFLLFAFQPMLLSCFRFCKKVCKKEKRLSVYYNENEIDIGNKTMPKIEAIFVCTKKEDTENLQLLLDSQRILVLTRNTQDQTPVQYAAVLGKKKSLRILNEYLENDEREDAKQWIANHVHRKGILDCLPSESEDEAKE